MFMTRLPVRVSVSPIHDPSQSGADHTGHHRLSTTASRPPSGHLQPTLHQAPRCYRPANFLPCGWHTRLTTAWYMATITNPAAAYSWVRRALHASTIASHASIHSAHRASTCTRTLAACVGCLCVRSCVSATSRLPGPGRLSLDSASQSIAPSHPHSLIRARTTSVASARIVVEPILILLALAGR